MKAAPTVTSHAILLKDTRPSSPIGSGPVSLLASERPLIRLQHKEHHS